MKIGNAWHFPRNAQPRGQASMRSPVEDEDIDPGIDVILTTGNQFQGGGGAGNQTQTGSAVMIRRAGDSAWTPLPMQFRQQLETTSSSLPPFLRIAFLPVRSFNTTSRLSTPIAKRLSSMVTMPTPLPQPTSQRRRPFRSPIRSDSVLSQSFLL